MTEYTFAQVPDWVAKIDRLATALVRQSVSEVLEVPIGPSINRSGKRKMGTIPKDFGILANSQVAAIVGGTVKAGTSVHALVAGRMVSGDVASFGWSVEYARAVHDGANGVQGTMWIPARANKWQGIVSRNVERLKGTD